MLGACAAQRRWQRVQEFCGARAVAPIRTRGSRARRRWSEKWLAFRSTLRAVISYAWDISCLLGWDAFCGLPGWQRWEELLDYCHIVVLQRPDADAQAPEVLRDLIAARRAADPQAIEGAAGRIAFIYQAPLAISATHIRQLLANGRSARFLLPDAVLTYIHAHRLYRAPH